MDSADVLLNADVEAAARLANLSVPHFRQLFRRSTGMPYATWLRDRRFQIAAQLLQQTSLTIPEILHRIGIRDPSHFIRAFKRKYGCTPAARRIKDERASSVKSGA